MCGEGGREGGVRNAAHLIRHSQQLLRSCVHLTHYVGLVQIPVITTVVCSDVYIYDVSTLQDPLVGDAMANYFIDRSAHTLGEVVVILHHNGPV